MKKILYLSLTLLAILICTGCHKAQVPSETTAVTIIPTTTSTEETTVLVTAPVHSSLYIPGLDVEDVILYFNEVCLDAEMVHSGNASLLQRWEQPIFYCLNGEYTEEDLIVLNAFAAWLNTVEGFPGIYEADEETVPNLSIYFCSEQELLARMGDGFVGMDGAVTFWYEDNRIYDAIICCRTDLSQTLRNSVILEELYNGLGPIQDTNLRPDSIIYSEYSEPQCLTQIDKLILNLLYHPDMEPGMDSDEVATVIRKLYY